MKTTRTPLQSSLNEDHLSRDILSISKQFAPLHEGYLLGLIREISTAVKGANDDLVLCDIGSAKGIGLIQAVTLAQIFAHVRGKNIRVRGILQDKHPLVAEVDKEEVVFDFLEEIETGTWPEKIQEFAHQMHEGRLSMDTEIEVIRGGIGEVDLPKNIRVAWTVACLPYVEDKIAAIRRVFSATQANGVVYGELTHHCVVGLDVTSETGIQWARSSDSERILFRATKLSKNPPPFNGVKFLEARPRTDVDCPWGAFLLTSHYQEAV